MGPFSQRYNEDLDSRLSMFPDAYPGGRVLGSGDTGILPNPKATRQADSLMGMMAGVRERAIDGVNPVAGANTVLSDQGLRMAVQKELSRINQSRAIASKYMDPESAARVYAYEVGKLRSHLQMAGMSSSDVAKLFGDITGGEFAVNMPFDMSNASGRFPVEPFVGPMQPQEPFVGPMQPQEPFVGPMQPQEPFVGPMQPQEPFVGPMQPQEPFVGPMQPQEPFVGPMQPPPTSRGWHPPMALPSGGGSSPDMRGAARRIAGSMFDRVMAHPGNTPAPAPALTPSPEPTPEKSAMMQWLEKYFARRI